MLPTNVGAFLRKMVTDPPASEIDNTGAFDRLRQTLSSSLLTAQDRVTKVSPRPSMTPDAETLSMMQQVQQQQQSQSNQSNQVSSSNSSQQKPEPGKAPSRAGTCRVCLKSFKPDDFSKICAECQQKVCEDCASYSKLDDSEDAISWCCSVCRRKMASRVCLPQDSTDSTLDVPCMEAIQRRHSEVKLGSSQQLSCGNSGLAPPRSPELRRHSDVSPASIRELEKFKDNSGWNKPSSANPSRPASPSMRIDFNAPLSRAGSRRQSRVVARQHSYDDDIKASTAETVNNKDTGLELPNIQRRASAYDVLAPSVLNSAAGIPSSRRSSFRGTAPESNMYKENSPSPEKNDSALFVEEDRRVRRRGSQLPDISAIRDRAALTNSNTNQLTAMPFQPPALEDLEAPRRQTSLDGEAIKIIIHDVDSGPFLASKRRVTLRRDPTDKAHRTRGFGMRVVGGKTGTDGRLFAYLVWTVPGGPAEKMGLQQGDKVLEWNGMSLVDRSFEEVCAIMDRTGDTVELLVEHAADFRMCDLLDEAAPPGSSGGGVNSNLRKNVDDLSSGLVPDVETTADKSPSSPTRRKLPKTPRQLKEKVSGRVQFELSYHTDREELVVSLMAADNLPLRDEKAGHGKLPETFAKVRILPKMYNGHVERTEVSAPTQNPIWNATLIFPNVKADELLKRHVEIELWDMVPHAEFVFLGVCTVDIQKALLDDGAIWCRIEEQNNATNIQTNSSMDSASGGNGGNKSATGATSTLSSFRPVSLEVSKGSSGDWSKPIHNDMSHSYTRLHRGEHLRSSSSDDVDSIGDASSLLHPDHAWTSGSRRGSSQSEQLNVEQYQLGKDYSHSLPGSRRSSFQDGQQGNHDNSDSNIFNSLCLTGRRRSSCTRRDPHDEFSKSHKGSKSKLNRTLSASSSEKRLTKTK
ncbi:regulating synaptic membrane exocytosis protein 2 [Contarinia nasturtii]|uniref:regulating synaptic membrane exocytosis protein 2 n=1 Tax=Contarinia nasturtii TaxID=265458 RepID=UPI0012D42A5D|nr:regulating synaptic membrane exocytosis protein 2 [Contarinia nasturtii]XP_031622372.1 regulating synaptic membrane exocytosis protein 2 [Contarinia nasturtii]